MGSFMSKLSIHEILETLHEILETALWCPIQFMALVQLLHPKAWARAVDTRNNRMLGAVGA